MNNKVDSCAGASLRATKEILNLLFEDLLNEDDYFTEQTLLSAMLARYEDNREEALELFEHYPELRESFFFEDLKTCFDELKSAYISNMKLKGIPISTRCKLGPLTRRKIENNTPPLSKVALELTEMRAEQKKRIRDYLIKFISENNASGNKCGIKLSKEDRLTIEIGKNTDTGKNAINIYKI